jgi:hypothetical protein
MVTLRWGSNGISMNAGNKHAAPLALKKTAAVYAVSTPKASLIPAQGTALGTNHQKHSRALKARFTCPMKQAVGLQRNKSARCSQGVARADMNQAFGLKNRTGCAIKNTPDYPT